MLNESPLHFIGRILGTAGAKYKEGFKSGFGKRGESLGSLFQSAVEKFQKKNPFHLGFPRTQMKKIL
ncbi:hypothetical protein LEP1GSC037_3772 [Leptospira interrogans str. 2006001854]|uniref:Uncharacterized protein n=1 Tax=Leptospira interrogans str. 2006001854 TaxID=1001590 RepID=M6GK92_LEPIR|nr:hypothetical protein LEP1GSC037_3772 [Leptospira interrogans str. 2006001854]